MPLDIFFTDDDSVENQLDIKVVLSTNDEDISLVSEHPSETKKSFIDNSVKQNKKIPVTIFLPSREDIGRLPSYKNNSEQNLTLEYKTSDLNKSILNQNISSSFSEAIGKINNIDFTNISNSSFDVVYRTKEEVYNKIKEVKDKAYIVDIVLNGRQYNSYIIESIKFPESFENGDGWDLEINFIEATIVQSKQSTIPKNLIKKIKSSSTSASTKNKIKSSINNKNKTSSQENKGDTQILLESTLEVYKWNPQLKNLDLPGEKEAFQAKLTTAVAKRGKDINKLKVSVK